MTRARGNRFCCIIFQMVGKLSGTRLSSSLLQISRMGGGPTSGPMVCSSGLAGGGLRPQPGVTAMPLEDLASEGIRDLCKARPVDKQVLSYLLAGFND